MSPNYYSQIQLAQTHFRQAFQHEMNAQWKQALSEYETAAALCEQLQAPEMLCLVRTYQARVFRTSGKIDQGLKLVQQAAGLITKRDQTERTVLYVRAELEILWGTLYLKMPLSQDKEKAKEYFLQAIDTLGQLELNVRNNGYFHGPSAFLVNLNSKPSLLREMAHNKAICGINLAELVSDVNQREAEEYAESVLGIAEEMNDWKLRGAALRVKGDIAVQRDDHTQAESLFRQSLDAYQKARFVNPEVVSAVRAKLFRTQTILGLEKYEQAGSPRRLPWFDKIPRPIVYFHKPYLLVLDFLAKTMPPQQASSLYTSAAVHWEGADWQDRAYQCLVKAINRIDQARINQLAGGEFHTQRRTEFLAQNTLVSFEYLLLLLLLPKTSKRVGIDNPVAEAFYYREKCSAIGLLDELETAQHLVAQRGIGKRTQELLTDSKESSQSHRLARNTQRKNPNELHDPELGELLIGEASRLSEVQGFIPPDAVLLEYYLTEKLFTVFVITPTSVDVPFVEGSNLRRHPPKVLPKDVVQTVRTFIDLLGQPDQSLSDVKRYGEWLYDALLRPTESLWRRDSSPLSRLIIVPHGVLHLLPFSALYDGSQFLAEIVPSVQSPSASVLKHCYGKRQSTPAPFKYFGIANPLGDLPGCDSPAQAVAKHLGIKDEWQDNQIGDASGSVFALRGSAATRSKWLRLAPEYTYLDLSTHGKFSEDSPLEHGFLVADDTQQDGGQQSVTWIIARDVFLRARLQAELLVAAMCYSGQLKLYSGDETAGLIRAFLFAGCRSLLLYSGELDDSVAAEFTRVFYQSLITLDSQGIPWVSAAKDFALQKAQKHIISRARSGESPWLEHPYYWAWTLIGDHS